MDKINKKLKEYIEKNIFPIYDNNDLGHKLDHIEYVIRRSLEFAKQFEDINLDMMYTIAAYHDVGHYIDKDNHEEVSAEIFFKDEFMKGYFSDEQRVVIKEAICDHRASIKHEIRSNYGKIVSSADRNTSVESVLKRTHAYSLKHYSNYTLDEMIERAYEHLDKKFGKEGIAKIYVIDKEYDKFKKDIIELLEDKKKFRERYLKANNIE